MSGLPYNKRPNDVFISYSHGDGKVVEPLVRWLQDVAGLRVWWDASRLTAGDRLAAALPKGLESARAAVFCVSQHWNASSWCEDEYNAALQARRADRRYRLIALHLDDAPVPTFLANARFLEMPALTAEVGAALLEALVPEPVPWVHGDADVYLSRSWHADDLAAADRVSAALVGQCGYRLVGDSPDFAVFDGEDRVRCIIDSCGALVAVLPFRDDAAHGFTSKWIVNEIRLAQSLGRPYLLFAADGVELDADLVGSALGRRLHPLPNGDVATGLTASLALLDEAYAPSPRPAYSFFATSLREAGGEIDRAVSLMEQVTGMQCLLGQRLAGQHAQQEIVERIRHAQFVLADVSENNLNTLIEAGVARGADVRLHLLCKRPESGDLHTRFMFRDLEISWYSDALARIGMMHRIARLYRRRIFSPPG